MRCTAGIVSDELKKITPLPFEKLCWWKIRVECTRQRSLSHPPLHRLSPWTGQGILTGGRSNATAHYLAGLQAGNLVIREYFLGELIV